MLWEDPPEVAGVDVDSNMGTPREQEISFTLPDPPAARLSLAVLISQPLLDCYGLGILMPYQCIICHICEHAITPSGLRDHFNGKEHVKEVEENRIHIPLADISLLQELWLEFNVIRDLTEIERIVHRQPALPGLKIISGLSCQHCEYSVPTEGSMRNHWSQDHPNDSTLFSESYVYRWATLQVFSTSCLRYFEVLTPPTAPPGDPWQLYMNQIDSRMPPEPTINLVPTVNEVPLLLKDTGWHIFLADIIPYTNKVNEYIAWIALPTTAAPVSWETRLKAWILKYMKTIRGEVHDSPLVVRAAIMGSPMTADTKHYIPLDNNDSLNTYAGTLYHFLLTIVRSLDNAERIKRLSLTSDDLDNARTLLHALTHSEEPNIELIQKLFLPLCYHRKAPSKWNNPMECLMALYALQDQGRFIDPSIATQLFARMKYHIRGCLFHEGLKRMGNYDDSALESMKAIASDTIQVGYETPFNTIRIYQKYATALVKGSTLPPTTLMSEDGMYISYKGHMLSIAAWRRGLARLLEETEAEVAEMLFGLTIDIQIPREYADNWSDVKTPGYS
ncbi:hypothetical protein M422DRAFT_267180 [Sphaerobolus stellatus SS14]|uniref:C2H2-type domain-containing protein n=1 Tax=Sphaerobolus stellatus (strain SS14) TaxID=990650 RepID=A0A0C9V194_SPHS4|nr:hypothetical protein M422DRAFT_267180 [Sphaerobolus stellatus SS14]